MRVAYVDETGHSAKEKIAVVGGVLIEPDRQDGPLAAAISALRQDIPENLREEVRYFHATDLFYGGKYKHVWPEKDRWALLEKLLAIPRTLKIPLVLGSFVKPKDREIHNQFSDSVIVHAIAFGQCLKAMDIFLRENCPSESTMVIAEDRDGAQKAIREIHKLFRNERKLEQILPPELRKGLPITRVKYPPSFADKDEEILLQIADACAWIWQRFLNYAYENERFMQALFGDFAQPADLGKIRAAGTTECAFWWPENLREKCFWLGFASEESAV
jgi:Protein of unknown function (DUF3800)